MLPMLTPQPMPTMPFFPFYLDSLLSSRGRQGGRSLMAAATTTGLLGLGSLYPLEAQAHLNQCVTLKGTALEDLTTVIDSRDRLRWQYLRIIKNDSLQIIDLSKLTELTYLQVKGNKNLTKITLGPTYLTQPFRRSTVSESMVEASAGGEVQQAL